MTSTDLDQQLAELQAVAGTYAARHQFIPDLTWPAGVRIAVNFTCDFDAMLLRRLLNEPPMQLAKGEFGGRVGIWRLIELFDGHGIKATIFTPGGSANCTRRRYARWWRAATRSLITCGSTVCQTSQGSRRIISPRRLPRSDELRAVVRSARVAAIALSCSGNTGISTARRARPISDRITSSMKVEATA